MKKYTLFGVHLGPSSLANSCSFTQGGLQPLYWTVVFSVFFFLFVGSIAAKPLLAEPVFMRLSTQQGLSQDSVRALLLDSEGFLWIGTDEGLNRYDGYQTELIAGQNNEFQSAPISALFQDSRGNLWVGTDSTGVYRFDLKTGKTTRVVNMLSSADDDYYQVSGNIFEDAKGDIVIAVEEAIVKYSYTNDATEIIYHLNQTALEQAQSIRWSVSFHSYLFIATEAGLYGLNLASGETKQIDYLQTEPSNIDKINSKFLLVDQQRLWIGTVEGLYSLPVQATLDYIDGQAQLPKSSVNVTKRNIWRMIKSIDDLFYLVTDQGFFSYNPNSDQLQHLFLPSDSREYLSSDALDEIIVDKHNNFWLGSEADGAFYWSPTTTLFTNISNARGGRENKVLSNNHVWSISDKGDGNLWVGTRNGLNLYNLQEGQSESFMVQGEEKAQYSSSSIVNIQSDSEDNLWLLAGSGIVHFNTKTKSSMPLKINDLQQQSLLNEEVYGMSVLPNGDVLFFNDIKMYRYSPDSGEVKALEGVNNQINLKKAYAFLPAIKAKPDSLLFSLYGQLWELDTLTNNAKLIHTLAPDLNRSNIAADSVVIDKNGILWIAYSGLGLVGLDSQTLEQKYFFNKDNLLPTNSIYGLQIDENDNIWMSSHAGILKMNPDSLHLEKFGMAQGLLNLEFNQFTNAQLSDGRMVYGSPNGLTVFDPQQLVNHNKITSRVRITNIEVSTSELYLPKMDLAGQKISLNYDDVGLTIHYSTLDFENQRSTQYRYSLSGESNVEYPKTRQSEVMFPKLEPGQYQFSITAFDPKDGVETAPAVILIDVAYAPWTSPFAYSMYILSSLLMVLVLAWRKRKQDLTLRLAHRQAVDSKNKLSLALTASNSGIWEYELSTNLFYASRIVNELGFNGLQNQIGFEHHLSLIHGQDLDFYNKQWTRFFNREDKDLDVTFRMRTADGRWIWYRDLGSAVESDADGNPSLITGTYTNMTERMADQENLRLFGEAFKHTHNWVLIYDNRHKPIAANLAFKRAFHISDNDDLGTEIIKIAAVQKAGTVAFWDKLTLLKANEHWRGEDKVTFLDGSVCDVLVNINAIENARDNNFTEYYIVIMSDITEQKSAEAKLRRLANFDSLTGLPNRALLLDRVERGLEHANRHHKSMALFFIDLDKFKQVNDSLGHKAGDELLKIVSRRLTGKLRKEDTVARLGGDEFVIMIEEVESAEAISALVNEIISLIDLPILLSNQTVSVSSSIGIAMYPGDGENAEDLLKNADIAMYHAKEQGRSNFQFFTKQMDAIVKERLALENKLKLAHQLKRFENYYQAIVDIEHGKVEGFEILMRWPSSSGMVPPDKFIPIAEELGLIEAMTLDAFERAMPVLKSLRKSDFAGYLSFNLSARHFESQSSIERIMLLLEQHQIPVEAIRFEITESALMRDYEKALAYMSLIKQKGFLIALDDFGTGFSSLKYLKEFPINVIKVDKSFVDDIGKNKNNESIILTTLSMASQLNMSCVAEGIETAQQVTFFAQHQCKHLQGYYFSKPVPADELPALFDKNWAHM